MLLLLLILLLRLLLFLLWNCCTIIALSIKSEIMDGFDVKGV